MSSERLLTPAQELALFEGAASQIIRIEQQPCYGDEAGADWSQRLALWEAGQHPDPATDPQIAPWLEMIGRLSNRDVSVTRVRVIDQPATRQQEWMRWLGRWNVAAGELIRYVSRPVAKQHGLLELTGPDDWWLFDQQTLLTLRFDDAGDFLSATSSAHSATIEGLLTAWELAVSISEPETTSVA